MRPLNKNLVAALATLSLVATACGGSDDSAGADPVGTAASDETSAEMSDETSDETSDDMSDMSDMSGDVSEEMSADPSLDMSEEMSEERSDDSDGPTTTDGASTLRAGLTSLLQEHVYLAGITVEAAVDAAGDLENPNVQAAAAALDENSVALSEAVGGVAGPENAEAFLGLWREHIGFFVDYTLGTAGGEQAAVDQALTDLEGYEQAAGAFFEEITGGEIRADTLIQGLDGHIATLTAAIDSVVAGEADAFDNLRGAAQHMFGAALLLSTGISNAVPEMFPGDVTSAPAETRAILTNLLQEHVYLAGIAIEQAVEAGGDLEASAVQAAVATLDANSVALSDVVGSVAGPENGEAFLGLWREHIGFFVDYTLGAATGEEATRAQALTDLAGYQQAAGAFFEEITGGELPADALVTNLDVHISTLTATIDSLAAGDGQVFDLLRDAAQHMPSSALALSTAIVAATG
jgi:hypothetical protein